MRRKGVARTGPNFEEVEVADHHRLLVPVDDDDILFNNVVLAKDDGTGNGEDRTPRLEDRACRRARARSAARGCEFACARIDRPYLDRG